jgi:hypothetical protein
MDEQLPHGCTWDILADDVAEKLEANKVESLLTLG